MRLIVDWHIHSKYSRSCSKDLELPKIAQACERKGIDIVATGDWTHPGWFKHIEDKLEEDGSGILRLKDRESRTRFMLVTEVSQIYKKGEATRRIHNLIFSPSLTTCRKVNQDLVGRGFNLKSDGRPVLGIDSEVLYKVLKEIDERIVVVPAHAWTPWFSVFGSKSGFNSLAECYGEMAGEIFTLETGLSSDPAMNGQWSELDKVALISNSDAHSLDKLGREANVFEITAPTYKEFMRVLREQDKKKFLYTIEFYPEEGKYHFDGCANCQFSCAPPETKRLGGACPKCKKKMTVGVANRVAALADRAAKDQESKIPFKSIVPLTEIIAECLGVHSTNGRKVREEYGRLTATLGSEFDILLNIPVAEVAQQTSDKNLPEAIRRMREGQISIKPGYDGIYGAVSIFGPDGPRKPKQAKIF